MSDPMLNNPEVLDRARSERDFRQNPPESAPGQDFSDGGWNDLGGSGGQMDQNIWSSMGDGLSGESDINAILNGQTSMTPQVQQPMAQQPKRNMEEVVEDVVTQGVLWSGRGIKRFAIDFAKSITNNNAKDWFLLGGMGIKVSLIVAAISGVLWFFSAFIKSISAIKTTNILLGAILSGAVSVVLWLVNHEEALEIDKQERQDLDFPEESIQDDIFSEGDDLDSSEENDDFLDWGDDSEDDDDNGWSNLNFDDIDDEEDDDVVGIYEEDINIESAIEDIPNINPGTQTREFLFETYMKVLPLINPDFYEMKPISEASDLFISFEQLLRDAATQVGTSPDKLPELLEMRENLSIIQLVATRPSGLKEQEIANEIANYYKMDKFGRIERGKEGVYATVGSVIGSLIINIFKSTCPVISLGDIYKKISSFVKDPKVKMPFVWGVNELGEVLYCDANKAISTILSGTPRSGKSWKVQSMLAQYCMFNSPKEVEFHIFDIKGTTSDYFEMSKVLPHIKSFEHRPDKILKSLKKLCAKEEEKRNAIFEQYGVISIADFKKQYPQVDLPYIYIVIDEMMNLTKLFSKEESAEFQDLLSAFVSRYPNLGFRVILIPHRIVNDVISKNVYSLVSTRASLRGTFDEIKNGLDITRRDFPYNLPVEGDMALKSGDINNGNVVYCHGEVITSSNQMNSEVFKYIGEVWKKLEPDYCNNLVKNFSTSGKGPSMGDISREDNSRPRDVTEGKESYQYQKEMGIDEIDDLYDEGDDEEDALWAEILKESNSEE